MSLSRTPAEWAILAERVQAGDEDAARCLAEAIGRMARPFFIGMGRSPSEAEDLAVTCVSDIIMRIGKFDGTNFVGWAFRIFRNQLASSYRRRPYFVPLSYADLNRAATTCTQSSANEIAFNVVLEALNALSPDDQKLLDYRHSREPMSYETLGKELGISAGAARVRYLRIRNKLEIQLSKDDRIQGWLARRGTLSRSTPPD